MYLKIINGWAFLRCSQLTTVDLGGGLVEIGERAFDGCILLHEITIPPTVKMIKGGAFRLCTQLSTLNLSDGLEEIGEQAFGSCTSLQHIMIPPTVTIIHDEAFKDCSNLTSVVFYDEVEAFVSAESMRGWWNHGIHEKSLSTYCFLVRCSIPRRLDLILVRSWQVNIHDMLNRIPSITPEDLNAYFASIDSKLFCYENLREIPMLLELAIRHSGITQQFSVDDDSIIALNVLSFI